MSNLEFFRKKKKKSKAPPSAAKSAVKGGFGFLYGFSRILLILIPGGLNYFLKTQSWYVFPITLMLSNTIWSITAFIVGFIKHQATCNSGTSLGYAMKLSSTGVFWSNAVYWVPPGTFIWPILAKIPILGYVTNGLVLQMGFWIAGWFMKC